MSTTAFELKGLVDVDVKDAVSNLNKVDSQVNDTGNLMSGSFTSKLIQVGKAIAGAFVVKKVVEFGKACVDAAANLEQVQKKTKTIFGDMSSDVEEWAASNERAFGLGSGTIQGFTNNVADITQGMGMAKDKSVDMAKGVTELGVKLANWNGIDTADAVDDLQKALTGTTKGLEKYGIKINDTAKKQAMANMGLSGTYDELDNATKAQVIYQAAIEASGNAIEYWDEGNRSLTFRMNDVKEQMGNIKENIGMLLLPAVEAITSKVADFMEKLAKASGHIGDFIEKIKEAATTGEGKLGFLKIFADTFQSIHDTIIAPIMQAWNDYFSNMQGGSEGALNGISSAFYGIADVFQTVWNALLKPLIDLIMGVVNQLKDFIAAHMGEIQTVASTVFEYIKIIWEQVLKPAFEAIGAFISNVLAPAFEFVFGQIIFPIVETVFKAIGFLWTNLLKPVLDGIIEFLNGVFTGNWSKIWNGLVNILKGLWDGIKAILWVPLSWFLDKISGIGEAIAKPFKWAANAIGNIWSSIKSVFKLPHFTFSGSLNPLKWAEEGLPKVGVQWYSKGGIFTQPTLLGNIGVGDADNGKGNQAEAVIPLDTLWSKMDAIAGRPVIITIDGKEVARAVAPHQNEFNKYNSGRLAY